MVVKTTPVLITGAGGFIGPHVVDALLRRGLEDIRCFVRPTSLSALERHPLSQHLRSGRVRLVTGNLLVREDCARATDGIAVIYHLAAGRGEKSIPDAFMNTVVATRNLAEAALTSGTLKRFVNVSSMSVYTNEGGVRGAVLDERSAVEQTPERRGDAYTFAKLHQERLLETYREQQGLPVVTLRPGWVYGPGNESLTGRVGIGTFGVFLHLGGSNQIPATYVTNCAEAIALAGIVPALEGEVINVVDDDRPTSRQLLRAYKRNVRRFPSLYVPRLAGYIACAAWERYAEWSNGQLPPVFNRRMWRAYWRPARYSNAKAKAILGWSPQVSTREGLSRYFEACRAKLEQGAVQ